MDAKQIRFYAVDRMKDIKIKCIKKFDSVGFFSANKCSSKSLQRIIKPSYSNVLSYHRNKFPQIKKWSYIKNGLTVWQFCTAVKFVFI
jgi:histidinol dehydrogenase